MEQLGDTPFLAVTSDNLVRHEGFVSRRDRERLHGHGGCVVWFTGLSGSGKSTLAHAVEEYLFRFGHRTYVLDGDNIRLGLCGDLGFSAADRHENIRRVGELAKLFVDAGSIVLAAFISPIRSDREAARKRFASGDFFEVYCDASLAVCEGRDVKGLYKKARKGYIPDFTGVSSPYEMPEAAELVVDTGQAPVAAGVYRILAMLAGSGMLNAAATADLLPQEHKSA